MLLAFEDRPSPSPYIERVWRSRSRVGGSFLSMAEGNIELVVTRLPEMTAVILRGPVTYASLVECPPNGEWIAIRFRLGTYLPRIRTKSLFDHQDMNLLVLPGDRFWFAGLSWEIPGYDNAEDFVVRLAAAGVIARDHAVDAAAVGDAEWMSRRSVQRHVLRTTGLTLGQHQQISRARHAAALLIEGRPILDASYEAGYFDQAHMTRSVKQLVGLTPAKLVRERPQLSFSYKTEVSRRAIDPLAPTMGDGRR